MSRIHIKIWWVMALVGVVALGLAVLPRWWSWHHAMLAQSKEFLRAAHGLERSSAILEATPASQRKPLLVPPSPDGGPTAFVDFDADFDFLMALQRRTARAFRHSATFPWLGPPGDVRDVP